MHPGPAREALRDHRLDDVAVGDVALGRLDGLQVVLVRPVRLDRLPRRPVERRVGQRGERAREALREALDLRDRGVVGGVDIAVEARVRDHLDGVQHVVEDQQRVREHQPGLRYAQRVRLRLRHALEVPDRLVADVADGAAVEARQAGRRDRAELGDLVLDHAQRVAVLVVQRAHAVGLRADERVAPHALAALDGFEQERVVAARDLEVGGDGRFEVGADLAVDRGEVALAGGGEAVQLLAARDRAWCGGCGHRRGPVRAVQRSVRAACGHHQTPPRRGADWRQYGAGLLCTIKPPRDPSNSVRPGRKRTTALGRWSSRRHPSSARRQASRPAARAHARHGHPAAPDTGRGGDALGLDNGAHTVDAYLPRGAFGPRLPGPFRRCCRAPGFHLAPALWAPRGGVLLPFRVALFTLRP